MKILTLNIHGFGSSHGTWEERIELIVDLLKSEAPDIACLQAVSRRQDGSDQAAQLASLVRGYDTVITACAHIDAQGESGNAFLSKYPARVVRTKLLPPPTEAEDMVTRSVLHARFLIDGKLLDIFNCHFSWVDAQNEQNVRDALPFLRSGLTRTVLLGDFNAVPTKPSLDRLREEGFIDAWHKLRPRDAGYSFEAPRPTIRIDYVLVDDSLAPNVSDVRLVTGASTPSVQLSDHLGVLVRLDL
jgi:endonuclease/exonuclease/phosphatase family metal-dependent hydrolase